MDIPGPSNFNPLPTQTFVVNVRETRQPIPKKTNKCLIMGFGITEIALGSFCVIMGVMVAGHEASHVRCFTYSLPGSTEYTPEGTSGEGVWCGIWIVIAGATGIGAGKKRSTKGMIYFHMIFATIGAFFAAILGSISCALAFNASDDKPFFKGITSMIAIAAFMSVLFQSLSASFSCCPYKNTSCDGDCCDDDISQEPTTTGGYYINPAQQQAGAQGMFMNLPNQAMISPQPSPQFVITSPQSMFTSPGVTSPQAVVINQPMQLPPTYEMDENARATNYESRTLEEISDNQENRQLPAYTTMSS